MIVITIALFALGHLVRDGWPPLGTTHGARALGAVLCGAGAAFVAPPLLAAAIGLAVLAGFYFDMRHAEGQNARGWRDACYLALSGVTSLVPLAFVLGGTVTVDGWVLTATYDVRYAAILSLGLAKPPIWFAAWRLMPVDMTKPARWLTPTRIAAMVFGVAIGAAVAIT